MKVSIVYQWYQLSKARHVSSNCRHAWSFAQRLNLNPDKSEVIWLGSRRQLAKLSEADKSLQLPDGWVHLSATAKNLGVVLDEWLNFDDQVHSCIKTCYLHLRRLKQIRRFIETDIVHSLVHALVTSCLDYYNSVLAGCNAHTVCRLLRVHNIAARLVLSMPYSSHSQPLLREHYWLPIESHIKFTVCILMYRVSGGTVPWTVQVVYRISIPGLPFPGRPGFPDFFHSRIPGNENASFPEKSGNE